MNANARRNRQIIRSRREANRDVRRSHTLASHARLAGLDQDTASGVAGALRSKAKACGITGKSARIFRRNAAGQKMWKTPVKNGQRYSRSEMALLVDLYRPRAARFVEAKSVLAAYAGN